MYQQNAAFKAGLSKELCDQICGSWSGAGSTRERPWDAVDLQDLLKWNEGVEDGRQQEVRQPNGHRKYRISCLDVYLKSKNLRTEAESSVSTKYLLVSDGRSDKTSDMRTSTLSCSRTLQDKKLEVEVRTVCGDSQKRKLKLKLRIFSSCRPTADWRGWIWVLDYNNLNFSPLDSNKLQDFCSFSGDQDWLILH